MTFCPTCWREDCGCGETLDSMFWLGNHMAPTEEKPGTPPDPKFLKAESQGVVRGTLTKVAPDRWKFTQVGETVYAGHPPITATEIKRREQQLRDDLPSSLTLVMTPNADNSQSQRAATIPSAPTHPTARIRIVEDREARLGAAAWQDRP